MATIPTHAIVGFTAATLFHVKTDEAKFLTVSLLLPVIPDLDVLLMPWIPYRHPLGHRGFSHSLVFAALLALGAVIYCDRIKDSFPGRQIGLFLFFFAITVSHGLLDALTDGGLGVGFFIPFNNARYFFPIRPIPVAPIGLYSVFSSWLLECLRVEFALFWFFAMAALLYRFGISAVPRAVSLLAAALGLLSWIWRLFRLR